MFIWFMLKDDTNLARRLAVGAVHVARAEEARASRPSARCARTRQPDRLSASRAARGRAGRRRPRAGRPRSARRTRSRPASPIRVRSASGRPRERRAARRARRRRPTSTRNPSTPSRTTSETPPTSVATTGRPRRERLDHAHRRALVRRREDERVEGGVPVRDRVLVAEREEVARDAELVGALLQAGAVGAVADQAQRRVDAALAELLEREQHVVRALDGGHPADPADDEAVVRDAEQPPCPRAGAAVAADPLLELDPEADDDEPLRRRDAEPDEVVAHLRAHGDERVGAAGEQALEQPEAALLQRAEVAAQDVAVERVDDDRPRRDARRGARRPGRPLRPSRCACAGCAGAARRISPRAGTRRPGRGAARSRGAAARRRATSTPSPSATNAIDSSPRASSPATSVVS